MNTRPIKGMMVVCVNPNHSALYLEEGRRYRVAKTENESWDRFSGHITVITGHSTGCYWADRFVTSKDFACSNAKRYKGVRPPRCNGGNPCRSCTEKYWSTRGGVMR